MSMRAFFLHFALIFVAIILLLLLGIGIFSPILNVREIHVARSDGRLDSVLIQQALEPLFGRRMPFVSVEDLPALLMADLPDQHRPAVPDLSTVTISKNYPSSLEVRLTLRPIAYRLSIDTPDQKAPTSVPAGSGSDFMTKDGLYVRYTLHQSSGSSATLPQIHIVDWSVKPSPWKPLLTADFLETMKKAEAELQTQYGQTIKSRTVYVRAREYHLQTQTLSLWFDLKSPLEEQLARYHLFLQTVPPGTAKQYVDLRITGKVIYK